MCGLGCTCFILVWGIIVVNQGLVIAQLHTTDSQSHTLAEFNHNRAVKLLALRGLTESNMAISTENQPGYHYK